jgi:hypothetical protein
LIFNSSASSSSSSFDSNSLKWLNAKDRIMWLQVGKTFEIAAQKVSDRLVQLADIKPGQKVWI